MLICFITFLSLISNFFLMGFKRFPVSDLKEKIINYNNKQKKINFKFCSEGHIYMVAGHRFFFSGCIQFKIIICSSTADLTFAGRYLPTHALNLNSLNTILLDFILHKLNF